MNVFNFVNKRSFSKVQELDLLTLKATKLNQWKFLKLSEPNLYVKNLSNHYGCVNALDISQDGDIIVSGGDDKRVLVWNLATCLSETKPQFHQMSEKHASNIFCVAIGNGSDYIYSAGNDSCLIRHNIISGKCASFYKYEDVIYCLSVQPDNINLVASACENNRVIIRDFRLNSLNYVAIELITNIFPMHGVDFNPLDTQYIATANSFAGTQLWDIRFPKKWILKYENVAHHFNYETNLIDFPNKGDWEIYGNGEDRRKLSSMSVRFDSVGRNLLVLRRRGYPILYKTEDAKPKHIFIDSKESQVSKNLVFTDLPDVGAKGYFNSCTMKSGSFAGCKSEFVVSGSDDFRIYLWKVPEESEELFVNNVHATLSGHRSIPNTVRYDEKSTCLISSGVEKIIKMWSGLPLYPHTDAQSLPNRNLNIQNYLDVMLSDDMLMTEENSEETIEEDVHMMTFFDSLIAQDQRRHRDRNHSRAYFDIYEDYDPMMDSDSDNSSLNFAHNPFVSLFNYLPQSSNESTSSNLSTHSSRSSNSSFDPELDDEDDDDDDTSSISNSTSSQHQNLEINRTPVSNTLVNVSNLFDEDINCQDKKDLTIYENVVNNGCGRDVLNNDAAANYKMQPGIIGNEMLLTDRCLGDVLQKLEKNNVLNVDQIKVISKSSKLIGSYESSDCLTCVTNPTILENSECDRLVINNEYIPPINEQLSIHTTKLLPIPIENIYLSPNKLEEFNFKRNNTNTINQSNSIDSSNTESNIINLNCLNIEIKNDSFVSINKNKEESVINYNFTDIIFKKINNKNRQYRN